MISKAEATTLFNAFNQGFSQRVDSQIRAAASAGLTSVEISYGGVTTPIANAVAAELLAVGWNVVNDSVNKVVTVS